MSTPSNIFTRYAHLMKWLVAFGVLVFLYTQVDADKLFAAMAHARIGHYLSLATLFVLLWFLIDSHNLMFVFTLFGHGIPFRDMRTIRGSSYLFMILNYNLGLGAIAWYLKKHHNIPLMRASGIMFYYSFVETLAITLLAMAGCLLIFQDNPLMYGKLLRIELCIGFIYIALFFIARLLGRKGAIGFIRNNPLFSALHEATLSGFILLCGLRVVYFLTFIVFFHFGLHCFSIHVPLTSLIGIVPVIFYIGNIPVTPFGLGTIQAAMMFFFKPYGSPEQILSFSVIYSATLLLFRAPIGLIHMGKSGAGFKDISKIGMQQNNP
jgi:uncharacterized membrane protein YbhN (UPF0104 family)